MVAVCHFLYHLPTTMTTLHFNGKDLLTQCKRIKPLIEKNPVLPICSDFHIHVSFTEVTITATNLVQTGQVIVPFQPEIQDEFVFTVDAAAFMKLVEAAPPIFTMKFDLTNHVCVQILVPEGTYTLPLGEDPTQFPTIPEFEFAEHYFYTNKENMKDLFDKVSYALSSDQLRPAMCCVNMIVGISGAGQVTATDAHALAKAWNSQYAIETDETMISVYSEDEADIKILWPGTVVRSMLKFLNDDEIYRIIKTSNHIFVTSDRAMFCFQVTEGNYPDTEAVIPQLPTRIETVDIQELQHVIDRMKVVANNVMNAVRLTFGNHYLYVRTENFDDGRKGVERIWLKKEESEETSVTVTVNGVEYDFEQILGDRNAMTVHVNLEALERGLSHLEYTDGVVQFGINGATRPITMKSFCEHNGEEACEIHLLMPILQPTS